MGELKKEGDYLFYYPGIEDEDSSPPGTLPRLTVEFDMMVNGPSVPEPQLRHETCDENILAVLLIEEVVFLNDNWWQKDWSDDAKKLFSINVNCNDVFAWGCADAESLTYGELANLWGFWKKDPSWGAAVWCMIKRNQMPQKPVEKRIREEGIWDLDALKLGVNTMAERREICSAAKSHIISISIYLGPRRWPKPYDM
jgi:hypothetical protein